MEPEKRTPVDLLLPDPQPAPECLGKLHHWGHRDCTVCSLESMCIKETADEHKFDGLDTYDILTMDERRANLLGPKED